jgi:hypothetical protein
MSKKEHQSSHEYRLQKQNWDIAAWARSEGMDLKTIETHPNVKDIRTLLDFDEYQRWMSTKDKEIWKHAWDWVYRKQFPIGAYIEKRLLGIVANCMYRQSEFEKFQQRKQKLKHIEARKSRRT